MASELANLRRVLHVPPTARDGQITAALLGRERVPCVICRDVAELATEIRAGAAAVLLTDEALLSPAIPRVVEALAAQPAWSDLPVVMLLRAGAESLLERSGLQTMHNVTILARPAPARSVVSAINVAIRARGRQYQMRDQIEEIRRTEARLRQSNRERERLLQGERAARRALEEAARMKDEFLATLSHELRTPLNAILGWSSLIRRDSSAQSLEQGLATIERNARVQVQLIDDLLDMSRITAGKLRLNLALVEPISFVQAAVDTIAPAAEAKGIELRIVVAGSPGIVRGDADRLQQVVWNLLSNAVKFTNASGSVVVSIEGAGPNVAIAVADSGPGIDQHFLPYVFDRFRQADASTTRAHPGLGLGLAIVSHLVEAHGGSIAAVNRTDRSGAVFTVILPVAAAVREMGAGDDCGRGDRTAGDRPLQGVTVLFVDDEPDARVLVQRILEENGADVRLASSADEAMAVLSDETPDVIVGDLAMPGKDGYALLRDVRASAPSPASRVPAIALSAFARPEDRARALGSGYDIHLAKPVEPQDLVAAVDRAARREIDPTPRPTER